MRESLMPYMIVVLLASATAAQAGNPRNTFSAATATHTASYTETSTATNTAVLVPPLQPQRQPRNKKHKAKPRLSPGDMNTNRPIPPAGSPTPNTNPMNKTR